MGHNNLWGIWLNLFASYVIGELYSMDEGQEPSAEDARSEVTPDDLADEFRNLGENLTNLLRSAWESEERRKLQSEIESGLRELNTSLRQAANEFEQSPSGQKLKTEVNELRDRVRAGEVQEDLRQELVAVLQRINTELQKARRRQPSEPESGGEPTEEM